MLVYSDICSHEKYEVYFQLDEILLLFCLLFLKPSIYSFALQESIGKLHNFKTTGIAMLFSAGTFLYVATVHVLPEVTSTHKKQTNADDTVVIHEHRGFRPVDLVAIVTGSVLPVLLSLGHEH